MGAGGLRGIYQGANFLAHNVVDLQRDHIVGGNAVGDAGGRVEGVGIVLLQRVVADHIADIIFDSGIHIPGDGGDIAVVTDAVDGVVDNCQVVVGAGHAAVIEAPGFGAAAVVRHIIHRVNIDAVADPQGRNDFLGAIIVDVVDQPAEGAQVKIVLIGDGPLGVGAPGAVAIVDPHAVSAVANGFEDHDPLRIGLQAAAEVVDRAPYHFAPAVIVKIRSRQRCPGVLEFQRQAGRPYRGPVSSAVIFILVNTRNQILTDHIVPVGVDGIDLFLAVIVEIHPGNHIPETAHIFGCCRNFRNAVKADAVEVQDRDRLRRIGGAKPPGGAAVEHFVFIIAIDIGNFNDIVLNTRVQHRIDLGEFPVVGIGDVSAAGIFQAVDQAVRGRFPGAEHIVEVAVIVQVPGRAAIETVGFGAGRTDHRGGQADTVLLQQINITGGGIPGCGDDFLGAVSVNIYCRRRFPGTQSQQAGLGIADYIGALPHQRGRNGNHCDEADKNRY